jgi:hypothetical protein
VGHYFMSNRRILPGIFCYITILYTDRVLRVGWNGMDFIISEYKNGEWGRPFLYEVLIIEVLD